MTARRYNNDDDPLNDGDDKIQYAAAMTQYDMICGGSDTIRRTMTNAVADRIMCKTSWEALLHEGNCTSGD
eukprot:CAMPEP_0172479452 /NCGR_PEP_ID=MMETSP1066-20121228/4039_1 /TAXON_ID=671091 /ORGANISM="Coscinodiscus wailesii, Strain CCMP2513" /LENGTH=70 /DNA_ID=CAMNT_0013239943 /DNA_START=396 /DNA_END=609 /DNA_ORIENTATION=-